MKTIAGGILTTIFSGLIATLATMFTDIHNLKADDRIQASALQRIERRLERIELKNDKIIESLFIKGRK